MSRQDPEQGRHWYVIHTYSGYESAVKNSILQRIESLGMQDYVFDVVIPEETQYSIKKGETVETRKKLFPGYALIDMIVTDESWYMVRNTPNVTGFVGAGNTPVPVSPEEFGIIERRMNQETGSFKTSFVKGEVAQIIDGPFTGYKGTIDNVDVEKGKLKVLVNVFERETPIELDFNQVKKID
ncbi:transcription termination/antitermination factor NusG [Candidatus Peregrinibacteria bacterium]|nr:MAG: transcription termination/antitermination factor NusG [Candidatus Peregrinibacteria bacterium]